MESETPDGSSRRAGRHDRTLDTNEIERFVVANGGHRGRALATRLASTYDVRHVDTQPAALRGPREHDTAHVADRQELLAYLRAHVAPTDAVVVIGNSDAHTLLLIQHLRTTTAPARIYAVLEDPRTAPAFAIPSVHVVCPGDAIATAVTVDTADATPVE